MTNPYIVEVVSFPANAEEFEQLQRELAVTPAGGAVMLLLALEALAHDEVLGETCLAKAVHSACLVKGPPNYVDYLNGSDLFPTVSSVQPTMRPGDLEIIYSQISGQPYLPHAFIRGAHPDSGYRLPDAPYSFELHTNVYSGDPDSGVCKLFAACAGAGGPRPVTVRRDSDKLWRASEWNSLIVSIAAPGLKSPLRAAAAVY